MDNPTHMDNPTENLRKKNTWEPAVFWKTMKLLPEKLWNSTDSELNSADFLWNSAEQRWFLINSEWQFLVHFSPFSRVFEVPQFQGT